jgi:hypothetical protein
MSRGKKYKEDCIYPFTFCPPGELNDPLGVPFDCRHPPLCIGMGVAVLVDSIVVLLLLSSIVGKQSRQTRTGWVKCNAGINI